MLRCAARRLHGWLCSAERCKVGLYTLSGRGRESLQYQGRGGLSLRFGLLPKAAPLFLLFEALRVFLLPLASQENLRGLAYSQSDLGLSAWRAPRPWWCRNESLAAVTLDEYVDSPSRRRCTLLMLSLSVESPNLGDFVRKVGTGGRER